MCARRRTYLLLLRQKKVGQEKTTPLPVSLRFATGSLRCSVLGCAAELAAFFELRSNSCGKLENDARVLRHALTPGPALLGTVRGDGAPHGPLLRSARSASLRLAWAGPPRQFHRQRAARTDPKRSCEAAGAFDPAPTPSGCAEERRNWGGRVCRRTHTLRCLARRCCLSAVRRTKRVQRRHPSSEHRRLPAAKRRDADSGALFLCLLSFCAKRK